MTVARAMNHLNFSGGPGILPESVLLQTQQAIDCIPEVGLSILGISHRSHWFEAVIAEAENNIRTLLNLSDDFAVLFLQGGATLQFSMIPMLLLRGQNKTAEYLRTGYWSSKAIPEAAREGKVRVVWDGTPHRFRRLPQENELSSSPDAAYFHYVSNETVEGTQFHNIPGRDDVPRICDMSSDFLSRPIDTKRYDLIYAHAQKNLGPAGVTVVLIRKKMLDHVPPDLPALLDYRAHVETHSIYNTPPVFAIYVVMLVTRWLLNDVGGLINMARRNQQKAALLYGQMDESSGFYQGWAAPENRSQMNAVFTLPSAELEAAFLEQAKHQGFSGLNGHRSLGGIRASLYNGMTLSAVEQLTDLMRDFMARR